MNLSQYRKPSSDKNNLISNKTKQYLKKIQQSNRNQKKKWKIKNFQFPKYR